MLYHWVVCFVLLQVGRLRPITCLAASANMGVDVTELCTAALVSYFSATGSRPAEKGGPIIKCIEASLRQGRSGERSQANVPAALVDYDALNPRLADGWSYVEVKTVPIAVPPGLGQSHYLSGGELSHLPLFPRYFPH